MGGERSAETESVQQLENTVDYTLTCVVSLLLACGWIHRIPGRLEPDSKEPVGTLLLSTKLSSEQPETMKLGQ